METQCLMVTRLKNNAVEKLKLPSKLVHVHPQLLTVWQGLQGEREIACVRLFFSSFLHMSSAFCRGVRVPSSWGCFLGFFGGFRSSPCPSSWSLCCGVLGAGVPGALDSDLGVADPSEPRLLLLDLGFTGAQFLNFSLTKMLFKIVQQHVHLKK